MFYSVRDPLWVMVVEVRRDEATRKLETCLSKGEKCYREQMTEVLVSGVGCTSVRRRVHWVRSDLDPPRLVLVGPPLRKLTPTDK